MKLGHLFTRIITLLMGGFKDRCEPDPRPQLYIPLCCVLDVPVALHLGGWLLVICWPPRPEQIGIIPLLGSWRAAAAAVRHNFMRGLTARKIGMISQIISRRQQRSPPISFIEYWIKIWKSWSWTHVLPYISQYLSTSRQSKVCAKQMVLSVRRLLYPNKTIIFPT